MDTLTIDGITYHVLRSETPADIEAARPNTARAMREGGTLRILVLQRPRGKRTYTAYDYGAHLYRQQYRILG